MPQPPRHAASIAITAAFLAASCSSSLAFSRSGDAAGDTSPDAVVPVSDIGVTGCSTIGCVDGVVIPNLATLPGADMLALTVRLCRNDACAEGSPTLLPERAMTGTDFALPGIAGARCTVSNIGPDTYRLDASIAAPATPRDGDRFTARVTHRTSGMIVAEASEAVRYTITTPNGPTCGPTCHTATLTATRHPLSPTDAGPPADGTPSDDGGSVADHPGHCFEIFPTVDPPDAAGTPTLAHANPMLFTLETRVGVPVVAGVRYYNFCEDPDPRILSIVARDPAGGPLDPSFVLGGPAAPGFVLPMSLSPTFTLTFSPTAAGTLQASVRVRFAHGYYDTEVTATAVPR